MKIKLPAVIKKDQAYYYKKRKRTELSIEEWEQIKFRWFQGDINFRQLGLEFKCNQGLIENRSSRESWKSQRETFWKDAQKRVREKLLEMFVDAGLPLPKLIKLVAEGAIRTTKLQNVKSEPMEWSRMVGKGDKAKLVKQKPYTLDTTVTVTDNDCTLRYRELAFRLLDAFPAPKAVLKINDDGNGNEKHFTIKFDEEK